MYHQIMTTIIWIHIHDVIDDVTRSQNRSNFEIDISPSLFALQRRSKAQNGRYAHGYLSGILSFRYNFRSKKFVASSKWRPFWKFWNIKHSFNLTSDMNRSSQIMPKKVFFVMMTSSMTSKGRLKVSLYIHVKKRLAPGANCKGNVSSINANIIIVFLGYTCQKMISMNYTFRDCRSKVNITGLLGDLGSNK